MRHLRFRIMLMLTGDCPKHDYGWFDYTPCRCGKRNQWKRLCKEEQ